MKVPKSGLLQLPCVIHVHIQRTISQLEHKGKNTWEQEMTLVSVKQARTERSFLVQMVIDKRVASLRLRVGGQALTVIVLTHQMIVHSTQSLSP